MTPLLLACASLLMGTPQVPPILKYTFESSEQGWSALQVKGSGGKVSVVHDPAHVKVGTGSLRVDYTVGAGQASVAAVPVADGALAKLTFVHFWLMADHSSPVAISLNEKGGGRYMATFQAPKGEWQQVNLRLSDFVLSTGADDPKDPNGKLDPEKIDAITMIDLDQFLVQTEAVAKILGVESGDRSMYLSDLRLEMFIVAPPISDPAGAVTIDTFPGPQVSWLAFGGGNLKTVTDGPLSQKSLRADYHVAAGHAFGVVKSFKSGTLAGSKTLSIRWASAKEATYILQLEEDGGAKYNRTLPLEAGGKLTDNTMSLSSFALSDDSKDANGMLDIEKVHQISILDIGAMTKSADVDNTLWVGAIQFKK